MPEDNNVQRKQLEEIAHQSQSRKFWWNYRDDCCSY